MTAYSAIANSEIAVGAPITNSLMTKNRDNPLAIQENDATAPTIAFATEAGSLTDIGSDIAALSADGIGTYAFAHNNSGSNVAYGATVAGSNLTPCNAIGLSCSGTMTGTWRCMGHSVNAADSQYETTLWLKIS